MHQKENNVIQTSGLSKHFGTVTALYDLDLIIPENAIVGFLGPNGSGKSTTIKLLLGLIKPSAGSGRVFGLDIVKDSAKIKRRVGYLAQQPQYYGYMTSREMLRYTARLFFSGTEAGIEKRVNEVLEMVGLETRADRPIKGFSGGERQRLGIAQAQINHPDLLILDEPAAALDPMGRHDVLRIMERLRDHTTIFYSTHILDDVQRVSDRVVILNQGKLVAQGSIDDLLNGSDATVYSLTAEGDLSQATNWIKSQPWVTRMTYERRNGTTSWRITVTDESAARSLLLRAVLADESVNVLEFSRQTFELEEVFMKLVEEK